MGYPAFIVCSCIETSISRKILLYQIVSEYDQEMTQSYTTDQTTTGHIPQDDVPFCSQ